MCNCRSPAQEPYDETGNQPPTGGLDPTNESGTAERRFDPGTSVPAPGADVQSLTPIKLVTY